ncbi:amidohydrolase [Thalassobacillus pellis]|uniref:amidohydrolase n=1 Tax=Thalassobacillus pellis TaxID=748008 RepID=UPI001960B101|nr:amidohydrolase [Thalassobacillus pellis]MBM7553343.1 putative amidohydrolase YtcJ [Thalassobacillus pellis]
MNGVDLIFINGNVITMNEEAPSASAVVVTNGEVRYAGENEQALIWRDDGTEVVDLEGKTLMPSFIESHLHPSIYGLTLLEVDCKPDTTPSIETLMEKIREKAVSLQEGEWIKGFGWDDSRLLEKRNPTRWDLDEVAPNHPVVIKRACAHMAVANSKALEISGISEHTPNPQGGNIEWDAEGRLTGLLQEKAQGLLAAPKYDQDDMAEGMKRAQEKFAAWGITTVHDMSTQTDDLQLYQRLLEKNELNVRVRPWMWAIDQNGFSGSLENVLNVGLRSGFGNELLKIQGLKFMLDGSVGGRTAAVSEAFEGTENTGILYNTFEEIAPLMKRGIEAGLRIAIHAIGDRAIDVAVDSFAAIHNSKDITGMRNRIEHCILPTTEHLEKMKELKLIAGSSLGFFYQIGDNYTSKLGKERMKHAFPHKSYKEYGIIAPGNSDLPVTDGNPWMGIYSAVTRKTSSGQAVGEEENICVWDALKAYTSDAAYSSCEEEMLGVIKPNAKADLMVISDNPLEIDPEKLTEIQTERTYLQGTLIFDQTRKGECIV